MDFLLSQYQWHKANLFQTRKMRLRLMYKLHIKATPDHPSESLAWFVVQIENKTKTLFIFCRVHLRLEQTPFASGLTHNRAPYCIKHHPRWKKSSFVCRSAAVCLFALLCEDFNYCVTKRRKISLNQLNDNQLVQMSHDPYHSEITEFEWSCCLFCAHISNGEIYKRQASRADAADTWVQSVLNNSQLKDTHSTTWQEPERDDELISTAAFDTFVHFLSKGLPITYFVLLATIAYSKKKTSLYTKTTS